MWRILLSLITAVACARGAAASDYTRAVQDATADLVKVRPVTTRKYMRYLLATRKADVLAWERVANFWGNHLSSMKDLWPVRRVRHGLYCVDIRKWGIPHDVWERFAKTDPYFHDRVIYQKRKTIVHAPHLGGGPISTLTQLAQSDAPILRLDWWLVETSQQEDRNGTGYFDIIGAANRREFEKLVGVDLAQSKKFYHEVRAIVDISGVTLNNRQLVRFQSLNGAYWVSLDVINNKGRRNALRNLDDEYQHDAEEIYAQKPNKFWNVFAGDKNGNRQDSVPPNIAHHHGAVGNDKRIHPFSCIECHLEGIRPIDDWARQTYSADPARGGQALATTSDERTERLRRLYLSKLEPEIRRDQESYAEAVLELTGLTPQQMARVFKAARAGYTQATLTLEDLCDETGYDAAAARARLLEVRDKYPPLDPALAALVANRPRPLRREHVEEVFPLFMTLMAGYLPAAGAK